MADLSQLTITNQIYVLIYISTQFIVPNKLFLSKKKIDVETLVKSSLFH